MSIDLSTRYLGLVLRHPIIASASPLTATVEGICELADAGAAAVVMPSLFEEQVHAEDTAYTMYSEHGSFSQPEAGNYFPHLSNYDHGIAGHLDTLRRAVAKVDIPVIASLNAVTPRGWTEYARRLEHAGAAAIELNLYCIPSDVATSGHEVEARYVEVVTAVRQVVTIPLAAKLSPFFSSTGHFAHQLIDAGADGLVLFNRFYQPDFDLATLSVMADLKLSSSHEAGPPMLWIALLAGNLGGSLAGTSGVETAEQVIKYLLAGADAVMTTSALLRHGPGYMRTLVTELTAWLEERRYASASAIRGLTSMRQVDNVSALLRAQYMNLLTDYVPRKLVA